MSVGKTNPVDTMIATVIVTREILLPLIRADL